MIETNQFFLQKEVVNKIELGIKRGPNGIGKCQKLGSSSSMGVPPPPGTECLYLVFGHMTKGGWLRVYISCQITR